MTQQLNWLEISGEALRHNLRRFRARMGPAVKLKAVVKSNAYGHGTEVAVRINPLLPRVEV